MLERQETSGELMRLLHLFVFIFMAGCTKVSENELKAKIDACANAGMSYTYLKDFKGNPYDVMCVAKRLR
jgi:hypothetical protein